MWCLINRVNLQYGSFISKLNTVMKFFFASFLFIRRITVNEEGGGGEQRCSAACSCVRSTLMLCDCLTSDVLSEITATAE